jgi:hypothetical protein
MKKMSSKKMKMGGSYGDPGIAQRMAGKKDAKEAYMKLGNTKPAMKKGGTVETKKYQLGGSLKPAKKDSTYSKTGVEGGGIYKSVGDASSSINKGKGMSKTTKPNRPFKMGGSVKKKK